MAKTSKGESKTEKKERKNEGEEKKKTSCRDIRADSMRENR